MTRPDCCTCDPVLCDTDDTGDSCMDCASCLWGCPADEDECCNAEAAP